MNKQEKEERIIKLKTERSLIYKNLNIINDELKEIEFQFDDVVGKCYCEHVDELGEQVNFMKVISINTELTKNSTNNIWYDYVYINSSNTNATISFCIGTTDEIFEGFFVEITEDEFNKALKKAQNEIKNRFEIFE